MINRTPEYYKYGLIDKTTIYRILMSSGSIVINKALMKALGTNETIIFCELLSRNNYFESRQQLTEDGFFFNTIEDLENGTTLSGYQQRKAIASLVNMGLIEMAVRGLPAKRYFRIIDNVENLITLLNINQTTENALESSNEETKELEVKKLDGNNTNTTILNNDNDNGTFTCVKDSECNQDVIEAMKTYMNDLYKQKTGKRHPYLKPEQYRKVYDNINCFAKEKGLDYEGIIEIMISYLNNDTLVCDYNINHFATDGIMMNRIYESGLL